MEAIAKKTVKKPAAAKKPKAPAAHKPAAHKPAVKHEGKHEVKAVEHKPEVTAEEKPHHKPVAHNKTFYAVGRRKTAVAQVLMSSGSGAITVNKLPIENYFQTDDLRRIVTQPTNSIGHDKDMNVKA